MEVEDCDPSHDDAPTPVGLAAVSNRKIMVFAASQAQCMLDFMDALSRDTGEYICCSSLLSRGTTVTLLLHRTERKPQVKHAVHPTPGSSGAPVSYYSINFSFFS